MKCLVWWDHLRQSSRHPPPGSKLSSRSLSEVLRSCLARRAPVWRISRMRSCRKLLKIISRFAQLTVTVFHQIRSMKDWTLLRRLVHVELKLRGWGRMASMSHSIALVVWLKIWTLEKRSNCVPRVSFSNKNKEIMHKMTITLKSVKAHLHSVNLVIIQKGIVRQLYRERARKIML